MEDKVFKIGELKVGDVFAHKNEFYEKVEPITLRSGVKINATLWGVPYEMYSFNDDTMVVRVFEGEEY